LLLIVALLQFARLQQHPVLFLVAGVLEASFLLLVYRLARVDQLYNAF